jgi:rSAM-associated Gly-rich repeat protein
MPPSRSAGLLAFLLALPTLVAMVPPAGAAAASGANGPSSPTEAEESMETRLRRLSEAIHARADQLEDGGSLETRGEPWVAGGAWGNGRGRGWVNRGWANRGFGNNSYSRPSVWANFRPGWGNFRNGPRFINW